jgi:hypothetical protein
LWDLLMLRYFKNKSISHNVEILASFFLVTCSCLSLCGSNLKLNYHSTVCFYTD